MNADIASAGGLFVAGADTAVGKTWVTVRLIEALRRRGFPAAGMKPVECGGRDDAAAILEASGDSTLSLDEVNPVAFPDPLAPAAMPGGPAVDFDVIRAGLDRLRARFRPVIVEGAGGWLVPVDDSRTMADLAVHLGLPVLVVAANRLGVLNHTLLTVRAIREAGRSCVGVYLNDLDPGVDASQASNAAVLRRAMPGVPVFEGEVEAMVGGWDDDP